LKNEESKLTNFLDRTSPSRNVDANQEEIHTPKSTPKKPKRYGGDRKKKLEIDKVLPQKQGLVKS
jgi:hypothetical protein